MKKVKNKCLRALSARCLATAAGVAMISPALPVGAEPTALRSVVVTGSAIADRRSLRIRTPHTGELDADHRRADRADARDQHPGCAAIDSRGHCG